VSAPSKYGWSDDTFKQIIFYVLSESKRQRYVLFDISSPPGTRKTFNVIRFALQSKLPLVASFPNHQNQETAFYYILSILENMRITRLTQYVIDYGGLENYCIFYRPELLMKLLDKFRDKNETYVDAVQKFLGHDTVFSILLMRDSDVTDEIWIQIARVLDRYASTRNKKEYFEKIKQIVEQRGQYEICTSVCPLGLFAWWWRKELYKFFATPKIVTFRQINMDELLAKYPRVARYVVRANPENFVEHLEEILEGKYEIEWLLCPRYLIMARIALAKRSGKPTFLSAKRAVFLTPHAGLSFILSVIRRQLEVLNIPLRYTLFLDEYDTLLKPKTFPLIPLDVIKTVSAIAYQISRSERYGGVDVDEYLKRYAEYVHMVLDQVVKIVENSIETRAYHPLMNIVLEGAFSSAKESILKTRTEVEYRPLGARVVHIKHFLYSPDTLRLFQFILNPKLYFLDLIERDKDFPERYRLAVIKFRNLIMGARTPLKRIDVARHPQYIRIYRLLPDYGRVDIDPVQVLREYLKLLLLAPRFAVYYVHNKTSNGYEVKLATIDERIYTLLTWSRKSILTSATPVKWHAYVMGANIEGIALSDYERVSKDILHSTVAFTPPQVLLYDVRRETLYDANIMLYTKKYREELLESIQTGRPIKYDRQGMMRIKMIVRQVAPLSSIVRHYSSLMYIFSLPSLQPLKQAIKSKADLQSLVEAIRDYLRILYQLYNQGDTVLVLAQNKVIALILARLLRAVPCHGEQCGDKVKKISHFVAKKRIAITWFRSRACRGIDLPFTFDSVLVVGSPYPRPQTVVHFKSNTPSPYTSTYHIPVRIASLNSGIVVAKKTLVARDFMNGISEMVQAVGRATRSVLRTGKPVRVYIPSYILSRVLYYGPVWFTSSVKGITI